MVSAPILNARFSLSHSLVSFNSHLGESQRKVAVDLLTTLVSYLIEILDNDLNSLHSHLLFLLGHTLNSLACTTPDALDSLGESTTFMLLRFVDLVYCLCVCIYSRGP